MDFSSLSHNHPSHKRQLPSIINGEILPISAAAVGFEALGACKVSQEKLLTHIEKNSMEKAA